jgi:Glycosyltransferase
MAGKKVAIAMGRVYAGGTTEVARLLGVELVRRGYEVDYWLFDPKAPGKESLEETGLPIFHWTRGEFRWSEYIEKVGAALGGYDFVILNGSFAKIAFAALEFLPDTTYVISLHHYVKVHPLEPLAFNGDRVNVFVGVSELAGRVMDEHFGGSRPVLAVPLGIPSNVEPESGREAEDSVFRIAYVGRLRESGKGIFMLPSILRILKDRGMNFHFSVIGDGKDRQKLEQKFRDAGVSEQVTFLGQLDRTGVYKELSRCHCSLLVSPSESFGLVLAEAQICGCLPVATWVDGSTNRIIEDEVTGSLCRGRTAENFAEKLMEWESDRRRWGECSQQAIGAAERLFGVATMGERYESLFKRLADGEFPLPRSRRATAEELKNRWSRWRSMLAWPAAAGAKRFLNRIRLAAVERKW